MNAVRQMGSSDRWGCWDIRSSLAIWLIFVEMHEENPFGANGGSRPSIHPAPPCLHKGNIGSIKLVAVFLWAHLRTRSVLRQVVYKHRSFFSQRIGTLFCHRDIQNCISNL